MTSAINVIRGLFSKNKTGLDNHISKERLQKKSDSQKTAETSGNQSKQFSVGWETSVGKHRDHNQDALLSFTSNLASNHLKQSIGVYAVADGIGGHKNGDIASEIAVQTIYSDIVQKNLSLLSRTDNEFEAGQVINILQTCTMNAHNRISAEVPGGGTTLTSAVIIHDQVIIAHIGDSRAYFVDNDGGFKILTRDHSIVSRMRELGKLTEEQAAAHPQKNVLYRALGQIEYTEPDIYTYSMPYSSYLLLCSDGLWGLISDKQMSSIIIESQNPQIACTQLVEAANDAGGMDNISVVLVRFPDKTF